jgi:hypothetical protein
MENVPETQDHAYKPKGPFFNRVLIWGLTLVFAVLVYLLEDYCLRDIESIKGPDRRMMETNRVDATLYERSKVLKEQIAVLSRRTARQQEEQRILSDGSRNLQETIGQLVELQKLTIQKELSLSENDQENLASALNQFLETQSQFQTFNKNLHESAEEKRLAEEEKQQLDAQIEALLVPVHEAFNRELTRHRMRLAALQLMLLIPLLFLAAYLVLRKAQHIYFPFALAFGIATLLKAYWVVNRYFPREYVKYILIIVLLVGVGKVLLHAIRTVAFPGKKWLLKQYREAYERFLCPICEYPIRTGPRRFLYWTRRTVHKTIPQLGETGRDQPYTCPSCGTHLFEECPSCHHVRHALLAHCSSCGVEKVFDTDD